MKTFLKRLQNKSIIYLVRNFLFLFLILFFIKGHAQNCTIDFSYTQGPNGQINFTPIITTTGTVTNCIWYFGDGNDQTVPSASNVTNTYLYNYTAKVCLEVNTTNCGDSICKDVVITSAAQNLPCAGNAFCVASANGPQTEFTHTANSEWTITDFGDGSSAYFIQGGSTLHQYKINGTYQVTSISYFQFVNNFYAPCDTLVQTIVVNNVPCHADFVSYVDTVSGNLFVHNISLGGANASWYLNGVLTSTNYNSFSSIIIPGTYSVCLVINGPNSCYDSLCNTIVFSNPVICNTVSYSYTPVVGPCSSYQFSVSSSGSPLTSTNWLLNGIAVSTSQNPVITIPFGVGSNTIETVQCFVSCSNGCISDVNYRFNNPASYYISLDTTGSINTWYAYPYSTGNISDLWDFGDGTTSTLAYPTHIYSVAGYYNVCHSITTSTGCNYSSCYNRYFYRQQNPLSISNFIVMGPTALNENKNNQDIKIYPNPVINNLNIVFQSPLKSKISVELLNSFGQILINKDINDNSNSLQLSTKGFPEGFYLIVVKDENSIVETRKIIISKE